MNYRRLGNLVWYLVITRIHVHMLESAEITLFDEISDLKELCPYSSFCGKNASSEFPYSGKYKPCCQSCSCKPDCSLRGNCCFTQLGENTREENSIICRHSFAIESVEFQGSIRNILNNSPHYRMVNKCNSSNLMAHASDMSCEQNSPDHKRPIHPMFSPTKGYIYINAYCAECNNVSDAVPWRRAIMCPPETEPSLSDVMGQNVKVSNDYSGCLLYYVPPTEADVDTLSCYPNVIRQCNITGKMKTRGPFWDFCKLFNATFTIQTLGFLRAYANVYCLMCNAAVRKDVIQEMYCTKESHGNSNEKVPLVPNAPLTIILDTIGSERASAAQSQDGMRRCLPTNAMVASFAKSCRPLKCPMGQLLINNRCDYYSKMWIGGPFAVMLRLSQLNKDASLPASFFKDMPTEKKNDRRASWIRRKTLKQWTFLVMYHLSEDRTTIEYIIVKATYPFRSVDPHFLQKAITRAFKDKWEVATVNVSVSFQVNLNDHYEYDMISRGALVNIGINTTNKFGYFPTRATCNNLTANDNKYDMLLFPVLKLRQQKINEGIFVTKMFFL